MFVSFPSSCSWSYSLCVGMERGEFSHVAFGLLVECLDSKCSRCGIGVLDGGIFEPMTVALRGYKTSSAIRRLPCQFSIVQKLYPGVSSSFHQCYCMIVSTALYNFLLKDRQPVVGCCWPRQDGFNPRFMQCLEHRCYSGELCRDLCSCEFHYLLFSGTPVDLARARRIGLVHLGVIERLHVSVGVSA